MTLPTLANETGLSIESSSTMDSEGITTPRLTLTEFLQQSPPDNWVKISTDGIDVNFNSGFFSINLQSILLYCDHPHCNRLQYFDTLDNQTTVFFDTIEKLFITYTCRNCRVVKRDFSVQAYMKNGHSDCLPEVYKFGEYPPFGPHVPEVLKTLLHSDIALFEKGLRAESRGLGIGAFTYYRCVVEDLKDKLFEEIIQVSKKIGIDASRIAKLEKERDSFSFSGPLKRNKDLIPESLLIQGENPLLLLHRAISKGVHAEITDDECLKYAGAIRHVLTELASRMDQVLHKNEELAAAIETLKSSVIEPKPAQQTQAE